MSYRLGILIVVGHDPRSAGALPGLAVARPGLRRPRRAAEDLGDAAFQLGAFRLDGAVGADDHRRRPGRPGLGRLVHLHSLPAVVSADHQRDEGASGEARRDGRPARQHLGRSRPRHARGARRLRPEVRGGPRPLVVPDRPEAGRSDAADHGPVQARPGDGRQRRRPAGRGRADHAQRPPRAGRSRQPGRRPTSTRTTRRRSRTLVAEAEAPRSTRARRGSAGSRP